MADPLVTASGIGRTYGADGAMTTALRDASFAVMRGDRIALMGPSGSGKSTLLHLLAGIDTPSAGSISWPALGPADELRPLRVSIVFQGPSLLPALSLADNVALPLLFAGASESEAAQAAADALEELDLAEVADRLPEQLSGGQGQRAALARALVVQPALLLADEPTGQQDRAHADEVVAELLEHAERFGIALVVATHDPAVAERLPLQWTLDGGRLTTTERT